MDIFGAQYFNGESAVSVKGSVFVTDAALHFDSDDHSESCMFSWDTVLDCRTENGRTIIQLSHGTMKSPSAHREIVCSNSAVESLVLPKIIKQQRSFFRIKGNIRRTILLFVLLGSFFSAVMWGFITQGYRFVSIETEKQIGSKVIVSVLHFSKEYDDPKQLKKVTKIVSRLKPEHSPYTYTVHLIDNPQVNAFAVPGGDILIFRGLFASHPSDAEIAGVLAHEISHVELRHGLKQMVRFMGISYLFHIAGGAGLDQMQGIDTINNISSLLVLFKYSRSYELEADANGVRLLKQSGYNPRGLIIFLNRIKEDSSIKEPPQYLSTHPATAERILKIEKMLKK